MAWQTDMVLVNIYIWVSRQKEEKATLDLAWAFETSKSIPETNFNKTIPTLTRPYLLIVSMPFPFLQLPNPHTSWS